MSDQLLQVFGSRYHGTRLTTLAHFDDVTSPSALLHDPHSTVVSAVRHAFVYTRVDPNLHPVSGVVCPEKSAQAHFSSLPRFLSEERPGLRSVPF